MRIPLRYISRREQLLLGIDILVIAVGYSAKLVAWAAKHTRRKAIIVKQLCIGNR